MSELAEEFTPRWASPPGATLRDALAERGITEGEFAARIDVPALELHRFLAGDLNVSADFARRLAVGIGPSERFWLAREVQYRHDLNLVLADDWANSMPVSPMVQFGWIRQPSSWKDRLRICLQFFDVPDFATWEARYGGLLQSVSFRRSDSFELDSAAVIAWLRESERIATANLHPVWDKNILVRNLQIARTLTRTANPKSFLPKLVDLCREAGVALIVLKAPPGCPVSGVARFVGDLPIIVLSARYLSDDHFWFTFFHEVAHLVLHSPQFSYIDLDPSDTQADDGEEQEANRFAQDVLIPAQFDSELSRGMSTRDIIRLASRLSIAPGSIVGQMQYRGIVPQNFHNRLKRRYRWNGTSLEKA